MTEKGGESLSHPTHTFCFRLEELGIGSPYLLRALESFQGRFPAWSDGLKQGLRGRWKASHPGSSRTSAAPTRVLSSCWPPSEKARINLPQAPLTSFIIPFLPGLWNPFPVHQLLWLHTACGIMPKYLRLKPFTSEDPVKLRFLLSCGRKNSLRDKVKSKEWFYSERNTLHRACCRGLLQRTSAASERAVVTFHVIVKSSPTLLPPHGL